jgi:hypothetical protein
MDSGGRREKAGERRFRRNGSRRKEDPEPRYEHWCRYARLPAYILAVLLLDVDPEDAVGGWLAGCWRNHFKILERLGPEPGIEWTFRLLLEIRDIHQYFEGTYRTHKTFHDPDSIDPKTWFEWARDLGLKIPGPFEALITKPSREQLEQGCRDLEKQIAVLRQHSASNTIPDDLHPKERSTLLKFVALLVKQYGFDPEASKSDAPGKIKRALETIGVSMDEKTIRKWLVEAAELPGIQ